MKLEMRQPMLAAAASAVLLAVGSSTPPSLARQPHAAFAAAPSIPLDAESDGDHWLSAARGALDSAMLVRMPHAELGQLGSVGARAFAFDALGGQTLEINLRKGENAARAPVFVEVFRVVDVLGRALHERLAALRPSAVRLRTRLPSDGTYHVLVQGGGTGLGDYEVTLELGAALPFPVVGAQLDSIRSLFGASRDAGRRHHEGVDIFVRRLTPVLAVAAGRAMPRSDALGGNTVWLNTPGTSYYYAHLDRVAVRDHQRVKVGDVLGYVGNTGNADGMPSHLHFGVYRWGREPVDPLPLLVGQRFDAEPAAARSADAGG
jgi:peptidoglycan LD-endopeptidase LytH